MKYTENKLKTNTKKTFYIPGNAKKSKNNFILKKKIKKIIQCDNLEDLVKTDTEFSEEGQSNDYFIEDEESLNCIESEGKHLNVKSIVSNMNNEKYNNNTNVNESHMKTINTKKIKNKKMRKEENDILTSISNIINSKSNTLLSKAIELTNVSDINHKKNKEMDVFDSNKSLAKQILKKIKEKKCLKKKSKPILQEKIDEEVMSFDVLSKSTNIKKKKDFVSYKRTVLELFNNCDTEGAIVTSVDVASKSDDNTEGKMEFEYGHTRTPDSIEDTPTIVQSVAHKPQNKIEPKSQDPKKYSFFLLPKCCILIMKPNLKLYFCGKLKATLIHGSVEILGHKLTKTTQEIYSLYTSSLLYFESLPDVKDKLRKSAFNDMNIPSNKIREIVQSMSDGDSVILLQPHSNQMTDFVSKHFYKYNAFFRDKFDNDFVNKQLLEMMQCHFFTEPRKGIFVINYMWDNISELILTEMTTSHTRSKKSVTMICGGMDSGKSSILRYLINRSVAQGPALVIDLDPGQPEFTVCGLLSATIVRKPLLGSNFTHLQDPERSYCLGLLRISENEERYMTCIKEILTFCNSHEGYSDMPWFINTSGYTGPLELKFITFIINIINPTIVVELKNNIKRNNYNMQLSPENINQFHRNNENLNIEKMNMAKECSYTYYYLEPFTQEWGLKSSLCRKSDPRDERFLNILAYFSQLSSPKTLSILESPPYVISMDDISLLFNNICVSDSYLYGILNGKLVALCHNENFPDLDKKVLGRNCYPCYGYGIIRGIDIHQRKVYVTTSVKIETLSQVNVLIYSEALPDCQSMSLFSLPVGSFVPYCVPVVDGDTNKRLMKMPKRKFNPFRLLEMKHKNNN